MSPNQAARSIANDLDEALGLDVKLTGAGIRKFLTDEFLLEALTGGITDTIVREEFGESVAQEMLGRSWPCYMDGLTEEQSLEFFDGLRAKLIEQGLAVEA